MIKKIKEIIDLVLGLDLDKRRVETININIEIEIKIIEIDHINIIKLIFWKNLIL